ALEHSRMQAKSRILGLFKAAAVLAVAECIGVAHAQAQSSGDFLQFNASHFRTAKYREPFFDSSLWEPQRRKAHPRSDTSRALPRVKAKSKSDQNEPATKKQPDGPVVGAVESVPLPRPRPIFWPEPHTFAEAAGPGFDSANVTSAWSDCDQR